jgi:ABC-2 type transport system permease protein
VRSWSAILRKELTLLSRDLHGLAVLFAMPVVFILVMSLAMQNEFASRSALAIDVLLVDADGGERAQLALAKLAEHSVYHLTSASPGAGLGELRARIAADDGQFLIYIPKDYFARFDDQLEAGAPLPQGDPIQIFAAPSVRQPMARLLEGAVREAVATVRLQQFIRELREELGDASDARSVAREREQIVAADAIQLTHLFRGKSRETTPSSVQQNVPAWLVFSMFFVAIPLSTTFIIERQQGTLLRLRSMDVSVPLLFAGKLVPYAVINQIQVASMLLVGVYLVPLLGGEALSLGHSPGGLALMAGAVSFGAIGYALLIAVVARTTEQATVLGGAGSILLGAVGGIMVPKFLMPEAMQSFSWVSPMAWGLEGFLDVLLRQGSARDVLPEAAAIGAFGLAALLVAAELFRRRAD